MSNLKIGDVVRYRHFEPGNKEGVCPRDPRHTGTITEITLNSARGRHMAEIEGVSLHGTHWADLLERVVS